MRKYPRTNHFLLVERQVSIDNTSSAFERHLSSRFEVIHAPSQKLPSVHSKSKKVPERVNYGSYLDQSGIDSILAAIHFVKSVAHKKQIAIIVKLEDTLEMHSSPGNDSRLKKENDTHLLSGLAKYERQINPVLDGSIKVICCFSRELIDNLTLPETVNLLSSHSGIIRNDWSIQPWKLETLMTFIASGLEESLGTGSTYLVSKTLRYVYGIDEGRIFGNPQLFEDKIKKLFGRSAPTILDTISNKLKDGICFTNENNGLELS